MGANSSRLGPRPYRRPKRSLSFFICGAASSSSGSASEVEDDPAELLVNSAEHGNVDKFPAPRKYSALSRGTGSGLLTPKSEIGVTSERNAVASQNHQLGDGSGDAETSNRGKYLSESKELVPSLRSISNRRSSETASSSYVDQQSADPIPVCNRRGDVGVNGENISINRDVCEGLTHHGSASSNELEDSSSDESSIGNHVNELMAFRNYDSSSGSAVSDSPLDNHIHRDDTLQEAASAGFGLHVSGRGQDRRDGNTLHGDVVSVSSSVLSSSSPEMNNEVRRNSRRLLWDAFSRRPRRYNDAQNYFSGNDDSDHLGHNDRWLLDFSGDFLGEGVGGDFRSYRSRTHGNFERRLHSRSEILERIRGGLDGNGSLTAVCPTGIHPEGSCSCESILRAEESGARASISRIVMLAEALFEVLDEIHRQPLSVSVPVVSLPAPESVVDSFPVKTYGSPGRSESSDDVAKCYICLAEYEEGDKIRVLPCHHEYHMSCVDKWLKEIHGVCPLCRGDVREGFSDSSASTSEIPSR